ncbi:MAG: DUF4169 family protein [Alphaproteobacteria bacterium]|nr:DUF4169 family protein [Alphaproteobacteria bacterium]
MVEPINLNKARKARARKDEARQAAENRVRFGRTKAEKMRDKLEAERAARVHTGRKHGQEGHEDET